MLDRRSDRLDSYQWTPLDNENAFHSCSAVSGDSGALVGMHFDGSLFVPHSLDPAVFAQQQAIAGIFIPVHPVVGKAIEHALDHPLGGKGLAAVRAAVHLRLVEQPGSRLEMRLEVHSRL